MSLRAVASSIAVLLATAGMAMAQPADGRDHAWIVDQDGRETPIYGCWQLVSVTHPNSNGVIGQVAVFNDDPLENDFEVEGVIRGPDGWLWSQVLINFEGVEPFGLLERVDTHTNPHRWYIVALFNEDGEYHHGYANTPAHFAGDHPDVDEMVFERVNCGTTPAG